MSSTITVRDIDPSDKAWLQAEAKRSGLSMESYVRKMIEEKRAKIQQSVNQVFGFRADLFL